MKKRTSIVSPLFNNAPHAVCTSGANRSHHNLVFFLFLRVSVSISWLFGFSLNNLSPRYCLIGKQNFAASNRQALSALFLSLSLSFLTLRLAWSVRDNTLSRLVRVEQMDYHYSYIITSTELHLIASWGDNSINEMCWFLATIPLEGSRARRGGSSPPPSLSHENIVDIILCIVNMFV